MYTSFCFIRVTRIQIYVKFIYGVVNNINFVGRRAAKIVGICQQFVYIILHVRRLTESI